MNSIVVFCIIFAAYFDAGSGAFPAVNLAEHKRVARATFGFTADKPGTCPEMPSSTMGPCVVTCKSDASCQGNEKCCLGSGQCGRTCQVPTYNYGNTGNTAGNAGNVGNVGNAGQFSSRLSSAGNTGQFSSRLSSAGNVGQFSSRLTDVAIMDTRPGSNHKDGACPNFSVGYTGSQCYGVQDDCSVTNGDADCSGMQKCCLTDCYITMCKNPI